MKDVVEAIRKSKELRKKVAETRKFRAETSTNHGRAKAHFEQSKSRHTKIRKKLKSVL